MANRQLWFAACLLWLLACPLAWGAEDKVFIRDVRVGFAQGDDDYFKVGAWAPITVDIEAPSGDFQGTLRVETVDGDGATSRNSLEIFVPRRSDRESFRTFVTYLKMGESNGHVQLYLIDSNGRIANRFEYPDDNKPFRPSMAQRSEVKIVLAITQPKWFDESTEAAKQFQDFRIAFQTDVTKLPEHWFGYQAVDTVILPTGGEWAGSLARQLANDEKRSRALVEWVRLGGHLIVSVSSNNAFVANRNSFPLEPILPARIDPGSTIPVERLEGVRMFVENKLPKEKRPGSEEVRNFGAEIADLTPRSTAEPFATELTPRKKPAMVHAPYGLGRITLLAFDTDQGPFMLWPNRRDFWGALLGLGYETSRTASPYPRFDLQNFDLTQRLRAQLEHFGEVRPIPFGWVALFIFLYVLLVGPFDYFFLKKVVKWFTGHERLEWTWVTFPTVVLLVSLGAYYLAHYLKGDELRINKVDVIDVDPPRERVYGTTWFTIFSPSLQHYDLGIEPVGIESDVQGMNLSWMPRSAVMDYLGRRGGTPSLFQRAYDYVDNGVWLSGVPINVWSMKTLTARWENVLEKGKPLFEADLRGERKYLEGSIVSHLPVDLQDCRLVYQERVWMIGALKAGERLDVGALDRGNVQQNLSSLTSGPGFQAQSVGGVYDLLRRASFYGTTRQGSSLGPRSEYEQNPYLEFLDQSWRIQNFHEAVLIGTLPTNEGTAVDANARQKFGSKFNPFAPALKETMTQQTMVRVFLPVQVARDEVASQP